MVINIELDEAAQRLRLYSVVGRPEGERFGLLLEANYLGQGTDGGSLGLQPDTGTAVLSREVPVAQLDVPASATPGTLHRPDRGLDQSAASGRVRAGRRHLGPAAARRHPRLIPTGASFNAPFDHRIAVLDHWPALGDLLVTVAPRSRCGASPFLASGKNARRSWLATRGVLRLQGRDDVGGDLFEHRQLLVEPWVIQTDLGNAEIEHLSHLVGEDVR